MDSIVCTAVSVIILALFSSWLVSAESHNVLYNIEKDHKLTDYVITSQRTNGILKCAHFCSLNTECTSINYKIVNEKRRGLCELNSKPAEQGGKRLQKSQGWSYAYVTSIPPVFSATFTNLGSEGLGGPDNIDVYKGTSLEGQIELKNGIQLWKVPYTGHYEITALGASGGNGTNATVSVGWRLGGRGARIRGTFHLKADEKLKILVGQQGGVTTTYNVRPGGGGGGTFVATIDNKPLLVAGGGGGGAPIFPHCDCRDGDPGQAIENGTRYGGTNGNGGQRYDRIGGLNPSRFEGTGGGGFYGDGASASITAFGGTSFTKGGWGGRNNAMASNGGYGGGGSGTQYPGGGGGYSGGGVMGDGQSFAVAGGGGSINQGTEQENESGVNLGHGRVVIRFVR